MSHTKPTAVSATLYLNLDDVLALLLVSSIVSNACSTNMCVMSIFNLKQVTTLLDMILSAEEDIHFLKRDLPGFWNHKEDESSKEQVNAGKEIECITNLC
jgi:hypothetical protein